jgi:hypothetical protein
VRRVREHIHSVGLNLFGRKPRWAGRRTLEYKSASATHCARSGTRARQVWLHARARMLRSVPDMHKRRTQQCWSCPSECIRFAISGALTTALKQLVVRVVRMLVSGTGMNGLPDFDSCVSEHSSTASRAHDCGLMSGAHDKAIRPLR